MNVLKYSCGNQSGLIVAHTMVYLFVKVKNLLRKTATDLTSSAVSLSSVSDSSAGGRVMGANAVKMTPEELEKVQLSNIRFILWHGGLLFSFFGGMKR